MTTQKTLINFEALLNALAQQTQPLTESLQHSLQEVGQALRNNQPEAAHQLRELIKQEPLLESAYQQALVQWDEQYTSQQRTKSSNGAVQNLYLSPLNSFFLHDVTPSQDWVTTARQLAQPIIQPAPEKFWDKADRIAVMTAGGAALGSAIGQIPGALIGAAFAAGYGWYISFAKAKSAQKPKCS
jgi:hypothetical protein